MTRKVTTELKIKVILTIDEGIHTSTVIDELDYNINSDIATVEDTEILNFEITDSR